MKIILTKQELDDATLRLVVREAIRETGAALREDDRIARQPDGGVEVWLMRRMTEVL